MALTNLMQLGLGTVAAGAVAVTGVTVAPMLQKAPTEIAAPAPEVIEEAAPEVIEEAASEVVEAPAPEIVPPALAPTLDTFRVESDGTTVFAGRAEPFQVVDIMLDGVLVERVTADGSGAFVAFPMLSFSDQSRALSLVADPDGAATASAETYLIAPIIAPVVAEVVPEPTPEPPAVETSEATPEVDPVAATVISIPTPQIAPAPAAAPAVLVATAEGVRVIQNTPSDTPPEVLSNVALDSITYDPSGDVLIAGRATGEGSVQVYLDNQPVTTSRIVEGGNWRTDLPDIDTGVYTLRVDQVDEAGDVVSRIETPFKREEPEVVEAAMAEQTEQPDFQVATITVQPGTTLWAIAREQFGEGVMYVEVFEANRDRIRDPNLIYPGQVFRMPEGDQ
ncbi:MAG: LysM peptidoglycan-binding domain-containing protein [Yoonia sp.]